MTDTERSPEDVARDPRVQRAVKKFVDMTTKDGGSVSITMGDKTVHIGPQVPTARGPVTTDDNARSSELPLQQPEGSAPNDPSRMNVGRLKGFITRVEKLEEERKAVGGDIKDVYSEAKGAGYDAKTIRKVISLRQMDAADRAEQETLLDVYKHALGMV